MGEEGVPEGGGGKLLHNLLLFGRVLRGLGLDVNAGRLVDLVTTLEHVPLARREDFRHAVRSLVVHRREEIPLFEEAFAAFWRRPAEGWTSLDLRAMGERRRFRPPSPAPPRLREKEEAPTGGLGPAPGREEPAGLQAALTYSEREVLRHKDFAELTGEEIEEVERLMEELLWEIGTRRTRRARPGRGCLPDLRRTLRASLRHGGEVLAWARRERKRKPRPLVVIADISGSMERYTRLLLLFVYGIARGLERPVEAFVFSTRLTRVTRQLRGRDVERALAEVSRVVPDWSGGTRIGEALRAFNVSWSRRVLGRGAVVLLISDGWDRGDVGLLSDEMARLQRSAHRLIWLNPLLGSPHYRPLTRGMAAALPFIDDFLPVHNLASLEDLATRLAGLEDRRPERRQHIRPGLLAGGAAEA